MKTDKLLILFRVTPFIALEGVLIINQGSQDLLFLINQDLKRAELLSIVNTISFLTVP